MTRFIKKWWLLRHLKRDCHRHGENQTIEFLLGGNVMTVARDAFVLWLAKRSVRRFCWILRWRSQENPQKLRQRIQEYNSLVFLLNTEGYVQTVENNNRAFICTTPRGDDFSGLWQGFNKVLAEYPYAWGAVAAVASVPILKEVFLYIWPLIKDHL